MNYDPEKVRLIVEEIRCYAMGPNDISLADAVESYLDKEEEIPQFIFVKLTKLLQKYRKTSR